MPTLDIHMRRADRRRSMAVTTFRAAVLWNIPGRKAGAARDGDDHRVLITDGFLNGGGSSTSQATRDSPTEPESEPVVEPVQPSRHVVAARDAARHQTASGAPPCADHEQLHVTSHGLRPAIATVPH